MATLAGDQGTLARKLRLFVWSVVATRGILVVRVAKYCSYPMYIWGW
jgi:hypothetical protein